MWNAECEMRNGCATVDSAFRTPHSALASVLNVALTGNIAAGKSTVVDLFRRWGATIIDADVLASDGTLDRAALRGKVMGDQAALDALNQIVHPAVRRRREELLRAAREGGDLLVVNDIPLLFEALDPAQFDAVVLVDAGVALRRTRLRAMRGLSNDEADRMIAAQMPAERKRAKSDLVIENEGSLEQLERQARAAFDELRHRAAVAALGGRPARVLPIAARYADAGLAVRRVTGDAAAIERALGQAAAPDAIVATAAAAAAAEQAWADAGRRGVLTSLSEDPDPVAVRLDLRPWEI